MINPVPGYPAALELPDSDDPKVLIAALVEQGVDEETARNAVGQRVRPAR